MTDLKKEIEEILEIAWDKHKNTPNFKTYDVEGINNLVRIAIEQALSYQKQEFEKILNNIKLKCSTFVSASAICSVIDEEIIKLKEMK